jgi:phosphatidylinositol phospholipase C, delta
LDVILFDPVGTRHCLLRLILVLQTVFPFRIFHSKPKKGALTTSLKIFFSKRTMPAKDNQTPAATKNGKGSGTADAKTTKKKKAGAGTPSTKARSKSPKPNKATDTATVAAAAATSPVPPELVNTPPKLARRYQKLTESQRSFRITSHQQDEDGTTLTEEKHAHSNSTTTRVKVKIARKQKDWTNFQAPATTVKESLQDVTIPDFLLQGIPVTKVTSSGTYKQRILTISQDKMALFCTHSHINGAKGAMSVIASTLPIPLWTPSRGWTSWSLTSTKSLRDRYVRYIDVADLQECLVGVVGTQTLEVARSNAAGGKLLEGRLRSKIVTIVFRDHETLNVVIERPEHQMALVQALRDMKQVYQTVQPWIGQESLLLRYIWYDVDVDGNGGISCSEFVNKICPRINLQVSNAGKHYKDFCTKVRKDGNGNGGHDDLTYGECMALLQSLKGKLPSHDLWTTLFGNVMEVSAEELWSKFLTKTQGETDTTVQDAQALLNCLMSLELDEEVSTNNNETAASSPNTTKATLSRARFVSFLHSEFNDAFDPEQQELRSTSSTKRLDQPMSLYWINTSHNTYLTGDQLQSRSSVEAYVQSLARGCKCLELDCWDGDEPSEKTEAQKTYHPVVYHGHTLTSKIRFASIIHVVDNYLTSHPDSYPIILSLENHCSHPFQRALAESMTSILGSKLFIPTKQQAAGTVDLPSPESLRGMAVIKGKRPPDKEEKEAEVKASHGIVTIAEDDSDDDDADPYDEAMQQAAASSPTASASPSVAQAPPPPEKTKKSKISTELAKLTLFHGTKFKSFDTSMVAAKSHMHSIGETKINKIINNKDHPDNADLWRQYNVHHMTRTYPAGTRVDSSNYNPMVAWAVGCQLVALNFQTHDTALILNDGRFRQNGNCGYVLKPPSVRASKEKTGSGDTSPKLNLTIRVLSGNCLPKPKGEKDGETIDPYVTVSVYDIQGGGSSGKREELETSTYSTAAVDNNGFCPVWNDAGKTFAVYNPDVAMVMFEVLDDDLVGDDRIATASIPISCLRKGYRSIQLYRPHSNSRSGAFQYATLLVEIQY